MRSSHASRPTGNEDGFTLIEIVVSILILGILSVSLLPLLINGLRTSASTAAIASATQLVNAQLNLAEQQSPTCTAVIATPAVAVGSASVYRGVPLQLTTTVGTCPTPTPTATSPSTISVTATVRRSDTGQVLATAKTLVVVSGG